MTNKGKGTYSKVSASKSSRKKAANKTQSVKKYPVHISALAKEIGVSPSKFKYAGYQNYGLDVYTLGEQEWMFAFDDDQADKAVKEHYESLYDELGIDFLNEKIIQYYLDDDKLYDYAFEVATEDLSSLDHYGMLEIYDTTDYEEINKIIKADIDYHGGYGYLINIYGDEHTLKIIDDLNAVNLDAIIRDDVMSVGRGQILSSYDGGEIELETSKGWMYAYRIN